MTLFGGYKSHIQENDLVCIQVRHDDKKILKITDGEITQTAKGAIRHSGLIGLPYGSKYKATCGDVYLLFPTPELWTLSLPHRTQIIYSHDIALICTELDLKDGSIVLESGTGSGSLTHSLARAVLPSGKVHTCEFHKERAITASQEFYEHGLQDVISVHYRDVCHEQNSSEVAVKDLLNFADKSSDNAIKQAKESSSELLQIENGFPKNTNANAVILDVPKPWLALKSAYNSMDKTKTCRFCTFSPCIEQVQKAVYFAYQHFKSLVREMKTVEFNVKSANVRRMDLKYADLGFDDSQKENFFGDGDENKKYGEDYVHLYSQTGQKVYGHTGYLTFFSVIPDIDGVLEKS